MSSPKKDVAFALLGAVESVYNTPIALAPATAADAILVTEAPEVTVDYKDAGTRDDFTSPLTGGATRNLPKSGRFANISARWNPAGFGAAYSAANLPLAALLHRIAGMSQTVVTTASTESVTYAPSAFDAPASGTLRAYRHGQVYDMAGVLGERFVLSGNDGGILSAEFSGMGTMAALPTDLTMPAITGYGVAPATIDPAKIESSVVTIGLHALGILREFEFTYERPISPRGMTSATGVHAGFNPGKGRVARVRMLVEAMPLATVSPWHTSTNLNPFALREGQNVPAGGLAFRAGAAAAPGQYRRVRLTAATPQLAEFTESADGGIAQYDLTFDLKPSTLAANDEFALIYD